MKYLMITLVILNLATSRSYAQRFHGGPLLGFNGSQVDGDTYSGFNKFGFMGGAYVFTSLSRAVDIQMEIKYMGKGAYKRPTDLDPSFYESILNYIEIPILLRYNMKSKIGIEGGLAFGHLFSYSEKDNNGIRTAPESTHFKPFELSSLIGLSYQLTPRLLVNFRYSYSILSIAYTTDISNTYFRHGGVYNNLFSTGLYYNFGK